MAENTKIQWATHTFNPWRGCTKVAAGCEHCYADTLSKRNPSVLGIWGPNGKRVKAAEAHWRLPIKWNREAECNCGAAGQGDRECAFCAGGCQRPRVFCASLADVFEDWEQEIRDSKGLIIHRCDKCGVDEGVNSLWAHGCDCGECGGIMRALSMNGLRRQLFALIDATPHLDWLLLTKRPENVLRMWPLVDQFSASDSTMHAQFNKQRMGKPAHRPNVWLLTSIATQADADRNIPELLKCRDLVPVLGVSAEPLIGPVDLTAIATKVGGAYDDALNGRAYTTQGPEDYGGPTLDWVIVGGESGHGAREFHVEWARSIIAQCKAADVPVFVKQMGANAWMSPDELEHRRQQPRYRPLKHPKGGEPLEWPVDVRVREFPGELCH